MLKRDYIILTAGGILVFSGIMICAAWTGSFVVQFLQENTIISQVVVRPSESINATLQFKDVSRLYLQHYISSLNHQMLSLEKLLQIQAEESLTQMNFQKTFSIHLKSIVSENCHSQSKIKALVQSILMESLVTYRLYLLEKITKLILLR